MRVKCLAAMCVVFTVPLFSFARQQAQQALTAPQQTPPAVPLRVGGNVMTAKLIHMVPPVYPPIAKMAEVSGTVLLHVIVGKDGSVTDVQVISGPALLTQAAIEAVKQWQYQPTLLNGAPVKVDTTVSVVFDLGTNPNASAAAPPQGTAQTQEAAPAAPEDPQLKASILKLLDVMHVTTVAQGSAKAMMQQMRPALIASLPPTAHREQIADAYGDKVIALLGSQEAMDGMADIYAKYFSLDDVNALIQFYQTPAGQHALTVMAQVMTESTQFGANLGRENLPRIFEELCKEYPELQGKTQFCPASSQTKSSGVIRRELDSSAQRPSSLGQP